jgi:hypothetical protein
MVMLLLISSIAFAQTRDDTLIYINRPAGGTAKQQNFFEENYKMEVAAAGYTVVNSQSESDFYFTLAIEPNEYYDPGYDDEAPYNLTLTLYDNAGGREMVQMGFPFTEMEEMYEWNLFLVYQAMANVPHTKFTGQLHTDLWRHKWIYLSPYATWAIHMYSFDSGTPYIPLNAGAMFGGGLGLEIHFLSWMSAETGIDFHFDQIDRWTLADDSWNKDQYSADYEGKKLKGFFMTPVLQVPVLLKFVWKPSQHFMLEPYIGIALSKSLNSELYPPLLAGLGGIQWAIKAGDIGGVFVDTRFGYDIGDSRTPDRYNDYHRVTLHFNVGYKFGFINRIKNDPNITK